MKRTTEHNLIVIIEPQRELCFILKRKQRWRLSLPLINRERNFIARMKSKNWNCKTKKCLKEEKPKTKNERGEREERRREGAKTRTLLLLYSFPATKLTNMF